MPGVSKGARAMTSAIASQIFSKTPKLTTFEESETQAYTLEDGTRLSGEPYRKRAIENSETFQRQLHGDHIRVWTQLV